MGSAVSTFIEITATKTGYPARTLVSTVRAASFFLCQQQANFLGLELDLPEYDSYEILRQQLFTAMTAGSEYFGFA